MDGILTRHVICSCLKHHGSSRTKSACPDDKAMLLDTEQRSTCSAIDRTSRSMQLFTGYQGWRHASLPDK